jgi:hypothetical protein
VRTFAYGEPPDGSAFYAVAVAALDDLDPNEIVGRIKYVDGRHGRYDETPTDTRLM